MSKEAVTFTALLLDPKIFRSILEALHCLLSVHCTDAWFSCSMPPGAFD